MATAIVIILAVSTAGAASATAAPATSGQAPATLADILAGLHVDLPGHGSTEFEFAGQRAGGPGLGEIYLEDLDLPQPVAAGLQAIDGWDASGVRGDAGLASTDGVVASVLVLTNGGGDARPAVAAVREGRLVSSDIDSARWDRITWNDRAVDIARLGDLASIYTAAAGPGLFELTLLGLDGATADEVAEGFMARLPVSPSALPAVTDATALAPLIGSIARDHGLTTAGSAAAAGDPLPLPVPDLAPGDFSIRQAANLLGVDIWGVQGYLARGTATELFAWLDPAGDGQRWVSPMAAALSQTSDPTSLATPRPMTMNGRSIHWLADRKGTGGTALFSSRPWVYTVAAVDMPAVATIVEALP